MSIDASTLSDLPKVQDIGLCPAAPHSQNFIRRLPDQSRAALHCRAHGESPVQFARWISIDRGQYRAYSCDTEESK
jgi:hypothetical protein